MKVTIKLLKKFTKVIVITAMLGLILSPLLPWMSENIGDETFYYSRMEYEMEDNKTVSKVLTTLRYSEIGFWGALVSGIIVQVGVAVRMLKKKLLSNYMMLSCIPLIAFGVVALLFNVLTLIKINNLGGYYGLGFNYGSIIMAGALLASSVIFTILVLPNSIRNIREARGTSDEFKEEEPPYQEGFEESEEDLAPPPEYEEPTPPPPQGYEEPLEGYTPPPPEDSYQEEQEPAPPSEEDEFYRKPVGSETTACPSCGQQIDRKALVCPECGENLSVRCPHCNRLAPQSVDMCPHCDQPLDIKGF